MILLPEQTPILIKSSEAVIGYYVVMEVIVTTDDTFDVDELATISRVLAMKMSDWSIVSTSHTGNTVTVSQLELSSDKIVALVAGQK